MKASRANAYRTETGGISSIMLKLGSYVVKEEVDRYYDFVCRYYSMPAKRRRNSFQRDQTSDSKEMQREQLR